MQLNRQTDYAIRAILYLAGHPMASIREISRQQCVPQEYLAKIIQRLAQAGLVNTHRGVGGGITLARPPEEIDMLQVIEAIEGPLAINFCLTPSNECSRQKLCAAHAELFVVQQKLAAMLAKIDFARMARKEAVTIQEIQGVPKISPR